MKRVLLLLLLFILVHPLSARASVSTTGPARTELLVAHGTHSAAQIDARTVLNLTHAGRVLLIPTTAPIVNARYFWYHVQWGDTLSGIANRYTLYYSTIRSLNPSLGVYPLAGEWLRLCGPCGTAGSSAGTVSNVNPVSANPLGRLYVVQPGDSLSSIASRFNVSISSLISVNRVYNPSALPIGVQLAIPRTYAGTSLGPVAVPTRAIYDPWTARALIAMYARFYGIEPSLALALAWQESGFNQSLVSRTGAVGTMQVEPYTGVTIAGLLGRPLNLYLLRDNIQAGVFWLAHLVSYYGGNERLAAAAYYQGTRSIARFGFFADTTQYANNVASLKSSFGG